MIEWRKDLDKRAKTEMQERDRKVKNMRMKGVPIYKRSETVKNKESLDICSSVRLILWKPLQCHRNCE